MLMTKRKELRELEPLTRVFLLCCTGCREIGFPEAEAGELRQSLRERNALAGELTMDYLCSPENLRLRLRTVLGELAEADTVLVMSCGVGVQTAAELLEDCRVCAACDTLALPGVTGVTPTEYDCARCGQCYLNLTGGICPITACSKSLLNGPCGGTVDGACEVCPDQPCGWDRILRRLRELGQEPPRQIQLRDFAPDRNNP